MGSLSPKIHVVCYDWFQTITSVDTGGCNTQCVLTGTLWDNILKTTQNNICGGSNPPPQIGLKMAGDR